MAKDIAHGYALDQFGVLQQKVEATGSAQDAYDGQLEDIGAPDRTR
jgi:hypothetical protein